MKTGARLNNIQVLRAFAAIVVAVFHTGFVVPSWHAVGSFGVDVFFVISGYIMARILDPADGASGGDHFFRHRLLRIVPPYWFFTLILFFIALRAPQLLGATRASAGDLIQSLLFIPFTKESGIIQPLLFVGWSLNYEMFFYVALAIGLLVDRRKAVFIGAAAVLAAILIAMTAKATFAPDNVFATFYSRAISIEFLLGILSYYLCRAIPPETARNVRRPALFVCIACALLLIVYQGLAPRHDSPFDIERVLYIGSLSFFLITSASLLSQGGWDIKVAWLVLIGDASYILYLVHTYCEYFLDRIVAPHQHWLATPLGVLVGVSFSILVAIAIHLYAERPTLRYLTRKFGGKRKPTGAPNDLRADEFPAKPKDAATA